MSALRKPEMCLSQTNWAMSHRSTSDRWVLDNRFNYRLNGKSKPSTKIHRNHAYPTSIHVDCKQVFLKLNRYWLQVLK